MTLTLPLYLDAVRSDGDALLAAARRAPQAAVPACPEWDVAQRRGPVGRIHRWVTDMLVTRSAQRGAFPRAPEGFEALAPWYEEGLAAVLAALGAADPDEPVWNWADNGPAPARFWQRRLAHETGVHRWDAELAVGVTPTPIDPALATDGIDETLGFVNVWLGRRAAEGLTGRLVLATTDTASTWALDLSPDRVDRLDPGAGPTPAAGAAAVRGGASDLLLWLVGRPTAAQLEMVGDPAVTATWERSVVFP